MVLGRGGKRSEALAPSSEFKQFWMPAFAGMTVLGAFCEIGDIHKRKDIEKKLIQ